GDEALGRAWPEGGDRTGPAPPVRVHRPPPGWRRRRRESTSSSWPACGYGAGRKGEGEPLTSIIAPATTPRPAGARKTTRSERSPVLRKPPCPRTRSCWGIQPARERRIFARPRRRNAE